MYFMISLRRADILSAGTVVIRTYGFRMAVIFRDGGRIKAGVSSSSFSSYEVGWPILSSPGVNSMAAIACNLRWRRGRMPTPSA